MGRQRFSLCLAFLLASLASVTFVDGASAITLGRCAKVKAPGFRCGKLAVPLDYSGRTAGSLNLDVRILKAARARRGTLVMLSGGPGQRGIDTPDYTTYVGDLAPNYDIVEIDQRGTGNNALRCSGLDGLDIDVQEVTAEQTAAAYTSCANQLGAKRSFFTSIDSARDIDALRAQLGLEKITIGGVSYGTYVSQVYARLFPSHTERLLLDSIVPPAGVQGIYLDSFAASRRILSSQCSLGRCFGITGDLVADVSALQKKLLAAPMNGKRVNANGKPLPAQIGGAQYPTTLFDIFAAGDFSEFLRAEYAPAVNAALDGDPAALMRLQKAGGSHDPPQAFSNALFAATTCAEDNFPWQPSQSPSDRRLSLLLKISSLSEAQIAPWGVANAAGAEELNGCIVWPDSPFSATPSQPLPDVPALLLVGRQDTRTPTEDAREVAALLPHATLIEIPNTGHSTIGTAECSGTAVRRFMAGRPVGNPCVNEPDVAYSSGPIPKSIKDFRASGGARGLPGRTASATSVSLVDAVVTAQIFYDAQRFPGLRRGYGSVTVEGDLKLKRYSFVPGIEVSGTLSGSRGRITVGGPAAAKGTVIRKKGRFRGKLGGKRVSFEL